VDYVDICDLDMYADSEPGPYICKTCNRTYKHYRSLQRHHAYACENVSYVECPFCPYKTTYMWNLKNYHIPHSHPGLSMQDAATNGK